MKICRSILCFLAVFFLAQAAFAQNANGNKTYNDSYIIGFPKFQNADNKSGTEDFLMGGLNHKKHSLKNNYDFVDDSKWVELENANSYTDDSSHVKFPENQASVVKRDFLKEKCFNNIPKGYDVYYILSPNRGGHNTVYNMELLPVNHNRERVSD